MRNSEAVEEEEAAVMMCQNISVLLYYRRVITRRSNVTLLWKPLLFPATDVGLESEIEGEKKVV